MSSTAKTLNLLTHFSVARPEIGLSQLCRLAGRDKATTHRHLQALEETGFVEQNPDTRQYRLGPALLHLAQTREATVPRKTSAEGALRVLADATGETSHVSVLSGNCLYPLTSCESPQHSIRAIIDIQTFPLHATASGLCALAFGPVDLADVAKSDLRRFTPGTVTNPAALDAALEQVRASGFARSYGSYETEVHSIAAPVFDHTDGFAGAVTVACVASRLTDAAERRISTELVAASRSISRNWGGTVPSHIETLWAAALSRPNRLEPTS